MSAQLFVLPHQVFFDGGAIVSGAKAYFYVANTLTAQDTYTTEDLDVAHANPVVADSSGEFAAIYLDPSLRYRVIIKDSSDVTIYDQDEINTPTLLVPYYAQTTAESSAGVTPSSTNYPPGDIRRYGGVADYGGAGSGTDNTTAFNSMVSQQASGGVAGYIPGGSYRFTSGLTISSSQISIKGDGKRVSRLFFDTAGLTCLTIDSSTVRQTHKDFSIETNLTNQASVGLHLTAGGRESEYDLDIVRMDTTGLLIDEDVWVVKFSGTLESNVIGMRLRGGTGTGTLGIRLENVKIWSSDGNMTYSIQLETGLNGILFHDVETEDFSTAAILLTVTAEAAQVRGIVFNQFYAEIPDDSTLLEWVDSASFSLAVEDFSFVNSQIFDLEATTRANIADCTLPNHASSYGFLNLHNVFYHDYNGISLTSALFDISTKVRANASQTRPSDATMPVFTASVVTGQHIRNDGTALRVVGDAFVEDSLRATHLNIIESTTAAMEDIGDAVNTDGLVSGYQKIVKNTTTGVVSLKSGSTAGSVWVNVSGSTTHTPV